MTHLSPHFPERDLTVTVHRPFIEENERAVQPWIRKNAVFGCQTVLEPARVILNSPLIVLSFFRCWALNREVGGKPTSWHMTGQAADVWPMKYESLIVPMGLLRQSQIAFDTLVYERIGSGSGWLHLQWPVEGRPARRRVRMLLPGMANAVPWDPTHPDVR